MGEKGGTQLSAGEGGQGSAAGLATALCALGRERKELGFGAARPQPGPRTGEKEKGGVLGRLGFSPLFFYFYSSFLFSKAFLNRVLRATKIQPKEISTTKNIPQHECTIKFTHL